MSVDMEENVQQRDYTKRTPREEAYQAIDTERAYQDTKYGPLTARHDGKEMTIEDWENLILNYWTKLLKTDDKKVALDRVRQIAAICVACMEQHGAPLRWGQRRNHLTSE